MSGGEVLTAYVGCALSENLHVHKPLRSIVVAMEVMSPVAGYLKFIVGAELLSKLM